MTAFMNEVGGELRERVPNHVKPIEHRQGRLGNALAFVYIETLVDYNCVCNQVAKVQSTNRASMYPLNRQSDGQGSFSTKPFYVRIASFES
jgi:hypothetical protein